MAINTQHDLLYSVHNYGIDVKNREIYLHSYVSESEAEPGVDYRSAIFFEKNLRHLTSISKDPILIHMHIPGGDWEDCMAIYDIIRLCGCYTIILAYGKVQSASSVMLQAANSRILMPNTNMLIHYGSISFDGEHSKAAASSMQWNEKECDKMVDIFTERCMYGRISQEKNWKKMMAKKHIVSQLANRCDWILNAEEAVYYGFADGILGERKFSNIDSLKKISK
jgi:ATP-dependent protease ClpP protease subunit